MEIAGDFSGIITPFFQLVAAMLLGMVVGAERDIAGKTAGMRTHALVAIGAALFTIISTQLTPEVAGSATFDPLRIAAGVITGVGFIGAGIIIFQGDKLHGLTTAAGLWVAAAVGIAVGYQLYPIALFAVLLALFVFRVLWYVEHYIEETFD